MKAIVFVMMATLFGNTVLAGQKKRITFGQFQIGKMPSGFVSALTGEGKSVSWLVQKDSSAPSKSGKVLAQLSHDETDYRFPLCVYDKFMAKDADVSVAFKAVAGNVDEAAGIVARYLDKNNYYVVRANALEDNINFYKVVKGERREIAGKSVKVSPRHWHILRLKIKGAHFEVYFDNGKKIFEAEDSAFAKAGKIGLWTKADSVTYFDDFYFQNNDTEK